MTPSLAPTANLLAFVTVRRDSIKCYKHDRSCTNILSLSLVSPQSDYSEDQIMGE